MTVIRYTKEIPIFKFIFGIALLFFGIVILFRGNLVFSLIFIMLGINLILKEGVELDLESKNLRIIKSIFGITFGKWQAFPNFEYVSVFRTKENQTIRVITAEANISSNVILLNLFYKGNKYYTVYKTTDKEDAFNVANHLKLALDIDILDATEDEKQWL